jgi:hypothetical protein
LEPANRTPSSQLREHSNRPFVLKTASPDGLGSFATANPLDTALVAFMASIAFFSNGCTFSATSLRAVSDWHISSHRCSPTLSGVRPISLYKKGATNSCMHATHEAQLPSL